MVDIHQSKPQLAPQVGIAGTIGRKVLLMFLFAFVGPFVGGLVAALSQVLAQWDPGQSAPPFPIDSRFWLSLLFFSYVAGTIPAFLTGVVSALFSLWLRPPALQVLIAGLIGGLVSMAFFQVVFGSYIFTRPETVALAVLPGFIAGLVCMAFGRALGLADEPAEAV